VVGRGDQVAGVAISQAMSTIGEGRLAAAATSDRGGDSKSK